MKHPLLSVCLFFRSLVSSVIRERRNLIGLFWWLKWQGQKQGMEHQIHRFDSGIYQWDMDRYRKLNCMLTIMEEEMWKLNITVAVKNRFLLLQKWRTQETSCVAILDVFCGQVNGKELRNGTERRIVGVMCLSYKTSPPGVTWVSKNCSCYSSQKLSSFKKAWIYKFSLSIKQKPQHLFLEKSHEFCRLALALTVWQ